MWKIDQTLTFPPEAEAPFSSGHLAILIGIAGVEEGSNADLVLVQIDGGKLWLVQVQVSVRVQLGEHPANGVLAAGHQALIQDWGEQQRGRTVSSKPQGYQFNSQ